MSGYIETGSNAVLNSVIAIGGINEKGLIGAYKRVFYVPSNFDFDSILAAKDKTNWDLAVKDSGAIYLGQCKFEDNSEEAQFFTDAALDINEETTPATKVVRAIQQVNACVHAEIKKLDGRTGAVLLETTKGFKVGRFEDDGSVKGRPATFSVTNRTLPTTETPVEYTQVDITFTDNDGDESNPCEFKSDFLFSEVDQVYPLTATVDNESSNGTTLTAEIKLTRAGGTTPLTGAVIGDFKAVNDDNETLTIASVSEAGTTGVYTVNITTNLTVAYVSFDGIRDIANAGTLYYMNQVTFRTS
ncbi:MAG: hypothetical protein AAF348_07500 [Bacteroidota bacterium]